MRIKEFLLLPSMRNLDHFPKRGQGERSRRHTVLLYASVCHTDFLVGLWLYDQRQQPVWGVGRLRLSFRGSREPRMDKCNDLRLFCILSKFGEDLC
jgi:hypothetical protein